MKMSLTHAHVFHSEESERPSGIYPILKPVNEVLGVIACPDCDGSLTIEKEPGRPNSIIHSIPCCSLFNGLISKTHREKKVLYKDVKVDLMKPRHLCMVKGCEATTYTGLLENEEMKRFCGRHMPSMRAKLSQTMKRRFRENHCSRQPGSVWAYGGGVVSIEDSIVLDSRIDVQPSACYDFDNPLRVVKRRYCDAQVTKAEPKKGERVLYIIKAETHWGEPIYMTSLPISSKMKSEWQTVPFHSKKTDKRDIAEAWLENAKKYRKVRKGEAAFKKVRIVKYYPERAARNALKKKPVMPAEMREVGLVQVHFFRLRRKIFLALVKRPLTIFEIIPIVRGDAESLGEVGSSLEEIDKVLESLRVIRKAIRRDGKWHALRTINGEEFE